MVKNFRIRMYAIFRNILFLFDAEEVHHTITDTLKLFQEPVKQFSFLFQYSSPRLQRKVCGIEFPNIVGLAAGFDKTGELYEVLSSLGFGFIECGTFTPLPQEGNPRPRLFRYPEHKAIVNRMGFNNPGVEKAIRTFSTQKKSVPRGINIGKNKVTPMSVAIEDYYRAFESLYPYADYMVINVSSPNTPNLRELQDSEQIKELLRHIKEKKEELKISLPVFVKLSPDMDEKQFYAILDSYLSIPVDGIILTNTTTKKFSFVTEEGGVSGLPLRSISTEWIRKAYKYTSGKIPIIGVGGIFSGRDALEKIMAGASLIQIYTGWIYEGPFLPRKILQYLDSFLEKENTTLEEITGIASS